MTAIFLDTQEQHKRSEVFSSKNLFSTFALVNKKWTLNYLILKNVKKTFDNAGGGVIIRKKEKIKRFFLKTAQNT